MSEGAAAPAAPAAGQEQGGTPQGGAAPQAPAGGAPQSGAFLGGGGGEPAGAAGAGGENPTVSIFGPDVVENGSFKEGWAESLQSRGLERLANKGMLAKTPDQFLKGLDDALGLVGKKQLAGYPTPEWEDADVAAFRRAAGVPEIVEGYKLKPDDLPEGVEFSDEQAQAYAGIFHKHHAPEALAKELTAHYLQESAKQAQQGAEAFEGRVGELAGESAKRFQQEWGADYETRLEQNQAFVRMKFGEEGLRDPIVRAALSHPLIVEMIDTARRELRGSQGTGLPGAGAETGPNSMSPGQQAEDIMRRNPNWRRDPGLHKQVSDLFKLQANQDKRRGR